MEIGVEQRNKIFAIIFIFIISIYIATLMHEVGHVITYYFYGCQYANGWVSPIIIGFSECYFPEGWDLIGFMPNVIATIAGMFFVSLIGLILFLFYKKSNYVRKHWILAILFYCLTFNFLLNGFLQALSGNDASELSASIPSLFLYLFAGFVGLFLIYHTLKFKELMLLIEPKMKEKTAKKLSNWFFILFVIIGLVYLCFPFVYYYLF